MRSSPIARSARTPEGGREGGGGDDDLSILADPTAAAATAVRRAFFGLQILGASPATLTGCCIMPNYVVLTINFSKCRVHVIMLLRIY